VDLTGKVAFQGERGAYSEEASLQFFGLKVDLKPCKTLPEVFRCVEKDEASSGVVPVENSIEGSVNQTYDLLLDTSLKVCGEIDLRIVHCLIANQETNIKGVKRVYSHPQALAQCRGFLDQYGFELIPFYDTAGSVRFVKENRLLDAAAVAGSRAAEIYGMKVLARGIEDVPDNFTRFFVLSKHEAQATGNDKTSIIFSAKHVPGVLHSALEEFAVRGINLTKIESRPTRVKVWEYNFYLDFEGHQNEEKCREALKGLRMKTSFIKVLGSYPKSK